MFAGVDSDFPDQVCATLLRNNSSRQISAQLNTAATLLAVGCSDGGVAMFDPKHTLTQRTHSEQQGLPLMHCIVASLELLNAWLFSFVHSVCCPLVSALLHCSYDFETRAVAKLLKGHTQAVVALRSDNHAHSLAHAAFDCATRGAIVKSQHSEDSALTAARFLNFACCFVAQLEWHLASPAERVDRRPRDSLERARRHTRQLCNIRWRRGREAKNQIDSAASVHHVRAHTD